MFRLAAVLTLCVALPLAAEEAAIPATPEPGPVAELARAWQLWQDGLAREDVGMLLNAVQLARKAEFRQASGISGPVVTEDAAPVPEGLPQDPASDAALALVQVMAEGDPDLADLAADVAAELARGRLGEGRIATVSGRIAPGGVDEFLLPRNGALPAEIALMGDGSGNLDLTVLDDAGAQVCADTGPTDRAYCGFVPDRNGFFTIQVTNLGAAESRYQLYTN